MQPTQAGDRRKWVILFAILLTAFSLSLDVGIIYIAYPALTEHFNTSPSNIVWITVAPQLFMIGLFFTFGRLGDMVGRRRMILIGYTLFTVGIGVSAVSPTIYVLMLSRVVSGVGMGIVASNSIALLASVFAPGERGKAIGLWGAVIGLGLSTAPSLGGVLVDTLGWRAVFYSRVPLQLAGMALVWIYVSEPRSFARKRVTFDIPGAVASFIALACLLLFINRAETWGFTSPLLFFLLVLAALFGVLFYHIERRVVSPLLDFVLFRQRDFSSAVMGLMMAYTVFSAIMLLLPFFLKDSRGFSALHAGLLLMAVPAARIIFSLPAGLLTDRLGPRLPSALGMACIAGGSFSLLTMDPTSASLGIIWPLALLGLGFAIFDTPNATAIMENVPADRLGTANAMLNTSRQVGQALGLALGGALWGIRGSAHVDKLLAGGLEKTQANREGLAEGFHDSVFVFGAIGLAALVLFGLIAWVRRGEDTADRSPSPLVVARPAPHEKESS
ncbi:MAG: MFS transporter [Chloroflexi bacterium]|nr:MFS transporter [Chloroflexota bacterium]